MQNKDRMIEVMGMKIPYYQDCDRCKTKLACPFDTYAYRQPCDECRNTKEWQEEQKSKATPGQEDALKSRHGTAVFEYKDKYGRVYRNLTINHKGDIIKDEPYKPLQAGKKDPKKTTFRMNQ